MTYEFYPSHTLHVQIHQCQIRGLCLKYSKCLFAVMSLAGYLHIICLKDHLETVQQHILIIHKKYSVHIRPFPKDRKVNICTVISELFTRKLYDRSEAVTTGKTAAPAASLRIGCKLLKAEAVTYPLIAVIFGKIIPAVVNGLEPDM